MARNGPRRKRAAKVSETFSPAVLIVVDGQCDFLVGALQGDL